MGKRIWIVIGFLVLACGSLESRFGQSHKECSQLISKEFPKYEVASKGFTSERDRRLLLYISINPRILNPDSMTKLAARIKSDFCNEERIQVIIFDQHKIAKRFIACKCNGKSGGR
jgi:hypothetical protein